MVAVNSIRYIQTIVLRQTCQNGRKPYFERNIARAEAEFTNRMKPTAGERLAALIQM